MFTDIIGYTALMGKDSNKALELIRISKEIQKPLVEKHNGKWLKEMGDGSLSSFGSALDAVNCSIEIQESARAKLDGKLRIGIHLGDVTVEEDDVHGDGVNVASRLESIADPGGIYISDAIEKAIRGQADVQAKFLGEIHLKNVNYGVRTYAVQGVGLPVPELKEEKEISGRFSAELQRRGVIRATLTYIVAGIFLILLMREGQSWVSLPEWSLNALVIALIAGLPMAIYLAWNYERSPQGFVRTTSRQSWQNPYSANQKKPLTSSLVIVGLILVIFVMYVYPRYLSSTVSDVQAGTEAVYDKSIAVLPFVNLSNDPDQEYFTDGMTDQIITNLARINNLKVIARTSVMQFKNTKKTVAEIAKDLNVSFVLEGSIQKSKNKIRVNAQLIRAKDNFHEWAEVYDRDLTDIFEIQDDISKNITQALFTTLQTLETESIKPSNTTNANAYDLYLLGKYYSQNSLVSDNLKNGLLRAAQFLDQAIDLDTLFANAYAELANVYSLMGYFKIEVQNHDVWKLAEFNANKSVYLDPNNSVGISTIGYIKRTRYWDWEGARKDYQKAINIDPNNDLVLKRYALLLAAINQLDSAVYYIDRAQELNPLDKEGISNYYRILIFAGKYEQARAQAKVKALDSAYLEYIDLFTNKDKIAYLVIDNQSFSQEQKESLLELFRDEGWKSLMITRTNSFIDYHGAPKNIIFENLNEAVKNKRGFTVYVLVDPWFDPIRSDPRFDSLLTLMGLDKYK